MSENYIACLCTAVSLNDELAEDLTYGVQQTVKAHFHYGCALRCAALRGER